MDKDSNHSDTVDKGQRQGTSNKSADGTLMYKERSTVYKGKVWRTSGSQ